MSNLKIIYSSKETVDIERNGKVARFSGDFGLESFRVFASTMKWLSPKAGRGRLVSIAEREEWVEAINEHFANVKDRVFFVEDSGEELPDANEKVAGEERNTLIEKVKKFFRMKSKIISRTYGYGKFEISDLMKVVDLLRGFNILIEVDAVETTSDFFRSVDEADYGHIIGKIHKGFADIYIFDFSDEDLKILLEQMIESNPEILTLHFTKLPVQHMKCLVDSIRAYKCGWIEWTIGIIFDELVAIVTASDGKEQHNALLLKDLDCIFSKA
jgi:hypothetical protein